MNATVSLPLSEIDTLRDNLEASQARVKELEEKQKAVRIEISERVTTWEPQGYLWRFVPTSKIIRKPPEYINLDEIIKPLREEEQQKVVDNTKRLEASIKSLEEQREKQKESHKKETEELLSSLDKLREQYKPIQAVENEMRVYKAVLEIANQKLFAIQNQGFWGRLFNPIK